jgi:hypothetical protein
MDVVNSYRRAKASNSTRIASVVIMGSLMAVLTACGQSESGPQKSAAISEADVLAAQKKWGDGIVAIGDTYQAGGDYAARASQHINDLYAYGKSEVLFKPTLASDEQFRATFGGALSYFVGGEIEEDKGFAIKPWSAVRFGEQQIFTDSDSAVAMGNYYFTPDGTSEEVKVEYTFGYIRDDKGDLRINVHHSSLPHSG